MAWKDPISGIEFVFVPPGKFIMGSPPDEPERFGNEKQHEVTLTKGFYLGRYPVTNEEYGRYLAANPNAEEPKFWGDIRFNRPRLPVVGVSWDDAAAFIRWLNEQAGQELYGLPTEAQWEYACRAGTRTPFYTGRCLGTGRANYDGGYPIVGCPEGEYRERTTPVDEFPPNPWGLHDMHGNVWEWCTDWYGEYPDGPVVDPTGPASGSYHVIRGGSWYSHAQNCRSALRSLYSPGSRSKLLGFRLACSAGQ
jgi:formylglycine-generating enzyme required for sulfatase activity